jgi:hypothetical protein
MSDFFNPRLRAEPSETQGAAASSSQAGVAEPWYLPSSISTPTTSQFASVFESYSPADDSAQPRTAGSSPAAANAAPTAASTATATADDATAQPPGIAALIGAIMNGSFTATNVTDPTLLTQATPLGNVTLSNFYYASDDTANQLAQLLGGKVVQLPPFGPATGFTEPLANFIQLPNGQTVNAAALAYYSRCGSEGAAQLTADLTQTINEGAAMTNYYQNGGAMPTFALGYTGPAISGMTYPAGTVAADGTVINPAMQNTNT